MTLRYAKAMTRYGIDAELAVRLVREGIVVPSTHQLVGPNVLRSDALSILYQAYRRGEVSQDDATALLDGITSMRVRLLGDRVSRAVAWKVAEQLGWADIGKAQYIAVAKLQADAFVTLDADLRKQVRGIVVTVPFKTLAAAS